MKTSGLFARNPRIKLALLILAVAGLLTVSVGAISSWPPERYEYKTVWFRISSADSIDRLQTRFTSVLNREAANGWEFDGRCAHTGTPDVWVDFVVFKRRIR